MTDKPEPTDQEILEQIAKWVVERRMAAPAILFLEAHKPLSFVGSQAMVFAEPVVTFFEPFLKLLLGHGFSNDVYRRFAEMMENRDNYELLIIAIERESQRQQEMKKEEKRKLKALKREAKERRKALRRQGNREDHG